MRFPPLYYPSLATFSTYHAEMRFAPYLKRDRYKTKRDLRHFYWFLCRVLGGFLSRGPQSRMWRLAKDSSDECESAATDVHTQFLGLNMSLLKNCVWTISR